LIDLVGSQPLAFDSILMGMEQTENNRETSPVWEVHTTTEQETRKERTKTRRLEKNKERKSESVTLAKRTRQKQRQKTIP